MPNPLNKQAGARRASDRVSILSTIQIWDNRRHDTLCTWQSGLLVVRREGTSCIDGLYTAFTEAVSLDTGESTPCASGDHWHPMA